MVRAEERTKRGQDPINDKTAPEIFRPETNADREMHGTCWTCWWRRG